MAQLASDNRELVHHLAATHQKLKLVRARIQQHEAVQEAQVRALDAMAGAGACEASDAATCCCRHRARRRSCS